MVKMADAGMVVQGTLVAMLPFVCNVKPELVHQMVIGIGVLPMNIRGRGGGGGGVTELVGNRVDSAGSENCSPKTKSLLLGPLCCPSAASTPPPGASGHVDRLY